MVEQTDVVFAIVSFCIDLTEFDEDVLDDMRRMYISGALMYNGFCEISSPDADNTFLVDNVRLLFYDWLNGSVEIAFDVSMNSNARIEVCDFPQIIGKVMEENDWKVTFDHSFNISLEPLKKVLNKKC